MEKVIDTMQSTMFGLLKIINDGGQAGDLGALDNNSTSNTTITNFEALCIADSILNNFETIIDNDYLSPY